MATAHNNFIKWLMVAQPGEVCVYHVGDLAYDRSKGRSRVETPERDKGKGVHDIANAAWSAYKLGDVTLTQKRVGDGRFEYLAIRTKRDRAI